MGQLKKILQEVLDLKGEPYKYSSLEKYRHNGYTQYTAGFWDKEKKSVAVQIIKGPKMLKTEYDPSYWIIGYDYNYKTGVNKKSNKILSWDEYVKYYKYHYRLEGDDLNLVINKDKTSPEWKSTIDRIESEYNDYVNKQKSSGENKENTDLSNYFRILATVLKIMNDFISQVNPKGIIIPHDKNISGEENHMPDKMRDQKSKIYELILRKNTPPGYTFRKDADNIYLEKSKKLKEIQVGSFPLKNGDRCTIAHWGNRVFIYKDRGETGTFQYENDEDTIFTDSKKNILDYIKKGIVKKIPQKVNEIQVAPQINYKNLEDLFFKIQSSNKNKAERMSEKIYMDYWTKAGLGWAADWKWVDKLSISDRNEFYMKLLYIKNKFKIK